MAAWVGSPKAPIGRCLACRRALLCRYAVLNFVSQITGAKARDPLKFGEVWQGEAWALIANEVPAAEFLHGAVHMNRRERNIVANLRLGEVEHKLRVSSLAHTPKPKFQLAEQVRKATKGRTSANRNQQFLGRRIVTGEVGEDGRQHIRTPMAQLGNFAQ